MKKFSLISIAILIAGGIITFLISGYTYSEGNRAGVLIKFSKKGFIFKTYEGELNIGGVGNIPNTAQFNQLWLFSVKDKAVAERLMQLEGQKVSLHYEEVVIGKPWDGETNYYVTDVDVLD